MGGERPRRARKATKMERIRGIRAKIKESRAKTTGRAATTKATETTTATVTSAYLNLRSLIKCFHLATDAKSFCASN